MKSVAKHGPQSQNVGNIKGSAAQGLPTIRKGGNPVTGPKRKAAKGGK